MSEAVRRLVGLSRHMAIQNFYSRTASREAVQELRHAIAAVEAEFNAVPAVTSKPGFDGRAKEDREYIDYVENYR